MSTASLLKEVKSQKIGKASVVVLPLKIWEVIANQLEELEMFNSRGLRKKIVKARSEKKLYTSAQVRKILGV